MQQRAELAAMHSRCAFRNDFGGQSPVQSNALLQLQYNIDDIQ